MDGNTVLEWARRADAGPFSSVGVIDRLAYQNWEPMISLAAVAAVTSRVRLLTDVLILPIRNAGLFAKQAATLDVLCNGRLTLGVGVGLREDDFLGAAVPYQRRGKHVEEQLNMLRRVWAGEPASPGSGPVGPAPVQQGGPEILIGARDPKAVARVGKWADGYISGPARPGTIKRLYDLACESWRQHNRPGAPRLVAVRYFSLGPRATDLASSYQHHYWAYNPETAQRYLEGVLTNPQQIQDFVGDCAAVGVDELVFMPCDAGLDQLHRLADVIA